MYCKTCGQDGPGDGICCTYCGSKLLAKEITLEQLEGNSSDTLTDPPADSQERPTIFTYWKWLVLAGFIFMIGILLCFPGFRSSLVRVISSPSGLMDKAYCNAIEHTFSYAQNISDWSPGDDISAYYQADIQFGDVALSLLADAIDVQAEDLTDLSNVHLSCDASYQNNLLKAVYDLSLCGDEIGTLEHYVDSSKMEQWILLPELNEQALFIKTSDNVAFSEIFNSETNDVAQLDPQMLTDISVYYTHIFIDGFENINKYRENVTCNGINQRMTVLQATISTEQLYRTLIAILEDAAVNPDVAYMISDMELQHGRGYYDSFIESLEKQKIILQELLRQSNTYSDFTVYTYLNRKNEISGFKLEYSESGNLYPVVSCVVAAKGLQFSAEIIWQNDMMIRGAGTVGEYINCSFSVLHSQQQICRIILNDFCMKQDQIKGSVCVIPAEEIMEHLFDQAQCYEAYLYANRLPDFQVELIFSWDDHNKETNITFYSNKASLANTCLLIQSQEASPVVLPQSVLDGNYESDYQLWSSGFTEDALNSLLERFIKIGVKPEAINEDSKDYDD